MNHDILPIQDLVVYVDTSQNDSTKKAYFTAIVEGEGISDILIPKHSFNNITSMYNELMGILLTIKYVRQNYDFDSITIINDCKVAIDVAAKINKPFTRKKNLIMNELIEQIKKELFGYPVKFMHKSESFNDQIYACDRISRTVLAHQKLSKGTEIAFKHHPYVRQVFSGYQRIFI